MPPVPESAGPAQMDRIVNLAKRRGFVFPSSEIYGGFRSTWDYGPLGVLLKRNVKEAWWRAMVQNRDDIVGLDAAILMAPRVWEASGHVATFSDPPVDCRNCKERFRADQLPDSGACPNCGAKESFTDARQFNLMFKTYVGPVEDDASIAYLRPETAQGIFVNFPSVQTTSRKKPPFGIAQIGKAFRNEITPGNFTFRTREFEQMELEFFVEPGTDEEWFRYWVERRMQWFLDLGVGSDKLRIRPHEPDELAHYAKAASDIEYEFPFGWSELEGIANRQDFDLRQHQQFSGQDLTYYDQEHDRRFLPFVVEPSLGVERALLVFLLDAFRVEEARTGTGGTEKRTLLALHRDLAPIKVAVLPLSRNEQLAPEARAVHDVLKPRWMTQYDDAGSIGRRYRRQDEVGTPYCVTVDFETLTDRQVTVRDRDSMEQERLPIDKLVEYLQERLS